MPPKKPIAVNWDNENQQAPPPAPAEVPQPPPRLPTLIPQGRGPISQDKAHANLGQGPVRGSVGQERMGEWERDRVNAANDDPNYMFRAFTDEIINRLGPDRIFKMTPHELGTLSAYMYLKLR